MGARDGATRRLVVLATAAGVAGIGGETTDFPTRGIFGGKENLFREFSKSEEEGCELRTTFLGGKMGVGLFLKMVSKRMC